MSTHFWIGLGVGLIIGGTLGFMFSALMAMAKPRNFNPDVPSADEIIDLNLNDEPPSIAPGRWPADRFYREKDHNDRPRH